MTSDSRQRRRLVLQSTVTAVKEWRDMEEREGGREEKKKGHMTKSINKQATNAPCPHEI